ncbi:hypothetical protein INR49_029602 [Caranx melampygus]|nr:hypothetical protein INR49_029602 [Caranx melampygus]
MYPSSRRGELTCRPDNVTPTEQIIQRLEKLLSMPGTAAEKQLFITEVLLPEVLIWWLQTNSNMCRYRAESMLLKSTSAKEEKVLKR